MTCSRCRCRGGNPACPVCRDDIPAEDTRDHHKEEVEREMMESFKDDEE